MNIRKTKSTRITCFMALLCVALKLSPLHGCAKNVPTRARATQFDLASGDESSLISESITSSDNVQYYVSADANVAACGKYIGKFKASKQDESIPGDPTRYDGCKMYAFLDEPSDNCFIIDNGGQYLLLTRSDIDDDVEYDQSYRMQMINKLVNNELNNTVIYLNGEHYCTVAVVNSTACDTESSFTPPISVNELKLNGVSIDLSACKGYAFMNYSTDECIILGDGEDFILLAKPSFLSEHASKLISEIQDGNYTK